MAEKKEAEKFSPSDLPLSEECVKSVSKRCSNLIQGGKAPDYIIEYFSRLYDAWSPSNPDGAITLCIAENKLLWDLIQPKVVARPNYALSHLGYDNWAGNVEFRRELARFLEERVFAGEHKVGFEYLGIAGGAGSVLEILFYAICDAGDGVIIPAPYYSGFDSDLVVRDGCRLIPANLSSKDGFALRRDALEEAYATAISQGIPVKALLLTTPNNPVARIYSREELQGALDFARSKKLHIVFDEVYALSVMSDKAFVSGGQVVSPDLMGDFVHVVYSFSKDFGMSGLRAGVIYSRNVAVLRAMSSLGYFAGVSTDTQQFLTELLRDTAFIDRYFAEVRLRLENSYRVLKEGLEAPLPVATAAAGATDVSGPKSEGDGKSKPAPRIRVLPGEAGLFAFVDCRDFLTAQTREAEDALWRHVINTANVNTTPGSATHNPEHGWFRFCFAAVSVDELRVGVQKFRDAVTSFINKTE